MLPVRGRHRDPRRLQINVQLLASLMNQLEHFLIKLKHYLSGSAQLLHRHRSTFCLY